jgi:asparagine synthase (glutamine-hydrolysing)
MCGIAGFVARQVDAGSLPRMLAAIAHRGPDGQGSWMGERKAENGTWCVVLGHRRLAIIDLAGGAQPMASQDGRMVVTYNGELYNDPPLRAALARAGHRFRTRCDTETIVHQVVEHGAAGVAELDGMFAFAAWDARTGRLTLARDRCGIKPLYYALLPDGGLVFASELTAVLAHGGVDRKLGAEGLASYFFSDYVHPPHTIAGAVRKLAPGHTLVWRDGRLEAPQPFWRLRLDAASPPAEDDGARAGRLWRAIETSVEAQLVSDVPVGIFLSGGIDSSTVAAAAAQTSRKRMTAFAIGFEDPTFDESGYARVVADRLGVELVTETLRADNLLEIADAALDRLDEPLADPSYLPTFLLSRLAARHVKVVLGGDGGDELWAGYPTYKAHRLAAIYAALPREVRARLILPAVGALPVSDRYQSLEWKLRRFTERWDDERTARHLRWMSNVDLPELAAAIPAAHGLTPATLAAAREQPAAADWLNGILAIDFQTYLPGSVLTKVDRAAMAHGLEVRPPLLGNAMVDLAFGLPSRDKLRGNTSKYLLKRAVRGRIPDAVIDRRKKGFAIPLAAWLRGPLAARVRAVVAQSPLWDLKCADRGVFARWFDEHRNHRRDRSRPLWALYVLDRWLRRNL